MTSTILERISTLSLSTQQLSRLPKLLEEGFPKMPCTVKECDVPQLFREPYIYSGYRPIEQEWRYYFLSIFQQHNEALNVWTHLLAAVTVLLQVQAIVEERMLSLDAYSLPFYIFILACLMYLIFSVLAHLLQSKSELAHYSFYFLDYVGVSAYQYGSALAHYFYSTEQTWYNKIRLFFLPGAAVFGWLSCSGCCYAKYRYQRPYPVMRKLCQVIPAGLAYILDISPIVHRIVVCLQTGCTDEAVCYHIFQIIFFLIAAYFFSCPVPEKFFPGCCDIVGHGHQIFHIFLAFCTFSQLQATYLDYKNRKAVFYEQHNPAESYVASCSFFGLLLCSGITANYLLKKMRNKLDKKMIEPFLEVHVKKSNSYAIQYPLD
ncbi:membrane progestin receptor beta [Protopterus annectens]|uniref:membrane progestin receptor beta n=1 Tax=Protopterus annectens TaxID=7888 RepID=UPI001CFA2662|nr:membrane progestin receptor beta [Protopterus annectens]